MTFIQVLERYTVFQMQLSQPGLRSLPTTSRGSCRSREELQVYRVNLPPPPETLPEVQSEPQREHMGKRVSG